MWKKIVQSFNLYFIICIVILLMFLLFSRDVIKWLFSAIMKSTECGESREAARERDEQVRWITNLEICISIYKEVLMHEYIIMAASVPVLLSRAEWCTSSRGCCPWLWRWTVLQLWTLPSCPRSSSICSSATYLYEHIGEEERWDE